MAGGTLFVLICLLCHLSVAQIIHVTSDCSHIEQPQHPENPATQTPNQTCLNIDGALDGLESGMQLWVGPGIHTIRRPRFKDTRGMQNVSIIGSGVRETVITCEDALGISFIGVANLSFFDLTITDCGQTGASLEFSVSLLKESLVLWVLVPPSTQVAVFIGDCEDVFMENVLITNTTGLGLLGINVIGRSSLNSVNFTRNIRPRCLDMAPSLPSFITPDIYDQVGGGAYFLYTDYQNTSRIVDTVSLSLTDCYFAHNADCTYTALISINFPLFTDEFNFTNDRGLYEYAVGAGGGLSVILANSNYGVNTVVANTVFYKNDARNGGGAYVATFAGFLLPVSITFIGCSFLENGVASVDGIISETYCKGGAGLAISMDQVKPEHFLNHIPPPNVTLVNVQAVQTSFNGNQAEILGGGVLAYSFYITPLANYDSLALNHYFISWYFSHTTFTRNIARFGSAVFFTQQSLSGSRGSVLTVLENIQVSQNINQLDELRVNEESSAVHTSRVLLTFLGRDNVFSRNRGSALHIMSTIVSIFSNAAVSFKENIAQRGGAIFFSGEFPYLSMYPESSLSFVGNEAILEGGAIYFNSESNFLGNLQPTNLLDCFLATSSFTSSEFRPHFGLFDTNISISFVDNSASVGGIVFGSSLESCPWASNISRNDNLTFYQVLQELNSTFSFSHEPVGKSMVSTLPVKLNATLLTSSESAGPLPVYPGQAIAVRIQVFDAYDNIVPSVVTSTVDGSSSVTSLLGDSGFWYTSIDNDETELRISSTGAGPVDVTIITEQGSLRSTLSVYLRPCPLGFSNIQHDRCTCNDLLLDVEGIRCLEGTVALSTKEGFWIGTDPNIENPSPSDLSVGNCILNYCVGNETITAVISSSEAGNDTVDGPKFDLQCAMNRAGVLCGGCAEGFSIVFGTNECLKCNNYWLFLIPVLALAGAIVFAAVALLEITIDKGWTNSVLFFVFLANFLGFLSPNPVYEDYKIVSRLISLQIGISTCFYDGMTTLYRSYILFVFPTYLFILMGIFTLLCRRFSWMSMHFSPAKTLVTLVLMNYFNVLTTTLDIIVPTKVRTLGGNVSYRWGIDPNQVYFAGGHIFLVLYASIVIFVYIIPLPLLLLFPPVAYRLLHRFSPFLDVLWAAYKPKLRFWLGIRVIVIILIYLTARIDGPNVRIVSGIILIVFAHLQTYLQPLKDKLANAADVLLSAISVMFLWGGQTISVQDYEQEDVRLTTDIAFAGLLITTYLLYSFLFIFHVHRQFPALWPKLQKYVSVYGKKRRASVGNAEHSLHLNELSDPLAVTSNTLRVPTPTQLPLMAEAPRYRDSILSVS